MAEKKSYGLVNSMLDAERRLSRKRNFNGSKAIIMNNQIIKSVKDEVDSENNQYELEKKREQEYKCRNCSCGKDCNKYKKK
jgi:hypothetical protein